MLIAKTMYALLKSCGLRCRINHPARLLRPLLLSRNDRQMPLTYSPKPSPRVLQSRGEDCLPILRHSSMYNSRQQGHILGPRRRQSIDLMKLCNKNHG